jgi:hypothetical protein
MLRVSGQAKVRQGNTATLTTSIDLVRPRELFELHQRPASTAMPLVHTEMVTPSHGQRTPDITTSDMASQKVDQANAGALLDTAVATLTSGGISCNPTPEASIWIRMKDDSRVWLSIANARVRENDQHELAQQVVRALAGAGLRLLSIRQAEELSAVERLVQGEALFVESAPA